MSITDQKIPLEVLPLDALAANEFGRINLVDGEEKSVQRLAEMGLREGVTLRMIRPGEPSIVALGDQRLSVRLDAETVILVETK
jgi:Fe2+ transport system protein FeoA